MTEFKMPKSWEFAQWAADNDRLVIAALTNDEDSLNIEYDETTIDAVRQRCVERFGESLGNRYFGGLIATLPDRRPDLFSELKDFDVDSEEGV